VSLAVVPVLWKPFTLAALLERVRSEVEKRESGWTKDNRELDSLRGCS